VVLEALERGAVPANVGLVEPGVDPGLALVREPESLARSRIALKVASGFGGIQQALIFAR
jgi:3-oxoacyl-(acyl-carrier-protein) synthase